MFCTKCGGQLNINDKFCKNCGNLNPNYNMNSNINNNMNQVNYQANQPLNNLGNENNASQNVNFMLNNNNNNTTKKKNIVPFIILGIVILIVFSSIANMFFKNDNNYDNNDTLNNNEVVQNSVKGKYTREVFSGNSFEYKTLYDTAIFKFNKDSTFEVSYDAGQTYKGNYEIYNGLYINVKANEIREDSSIKNNEELADNITSAANEMIADNILNSYLLWLKTDDGILQPFLIDYNPEYNSGLAVNVYAMIQGTFSLK